MRFLSQHRVCYIPVSLKATHLPLGSCSMPASQSHAIGLHSALSAQSPRSPLHPTMQLQVSPQTAMRKHLYSCRRHIFFHFVLLGVGHTFFNWKHHLCLYSRCVFFVYLAFLAHNQMLHSSPRQLLFPVHTHKCKLSSCESGTFHQPEKEG